MKIAIHYRKGSFSERWIAYCKKNNISYKKVNCFDNNIIEQLNDCDALMWHFHHASSLDALLAKPLLFSLEQSGLQVFPDFNTAWHFDDKVAQKYLLETLDIPLVPSYTFYNKKAAMQWAESIDFPKVFKLKGGAGSKNVKLIKTKKEAKKIIKKAFGSGFPLIDKWNYLKEIKFKKQALHIKIIDIARGVKRGLLASGGNEFKNEKGYVYFQKFIPNNNFDIRVIVIKNKAFAIKRMVRKNDFRASGSGQIIYDKASIDERCLAIAFEATIKLDAQCLAYDFVFDENLNPLVVEVSYGFSVEAYDACPGYWDSNLKWCEGPFNPQEWMIEEVLSKIVNRTYL